MKKKYYEDHKEEISKKSKLYYQEHREKILAYQKAYSLEHKEYNREYKKKYQQDNKLILSEKQSANYEKNKADISIRVKKYAGEHKIFIAAWSKVYRLENKETIAANSKKYREENPDKRKQYISVNAERIAKRRKKYMRDNPIKYLIYSQQRRARKKALPSTLTVQQWEKIQSDFSGTCAYCGEIKKLTMEHFIPLSKQGELTTNNIIPICSFCNCSRHNKDFSVWYPKQPFYSPTREAKILAYLGYKNNMQQLSFM